MNKNLASYLKDLRTGKGITQEEAAQELFVSRQAISSWERGISIPDIGLLTSIAEFYNVDVSTLIYGEMISNRRNTSLNRRIIYFVASILTLVLILSIYTMRQIPDLTEEVTELDDLLIITNIHIESESIDFSVIHEFEYRHIVEFEIYSQVEEAYLDGGELLDFKLSIGTNNYVGDLKPQYIGRAGNSDIYELVYQGVVRRNSK